MLAIGSLFLILTTVGGALTVLNALCLSHHSIINGDYYPHFTDKETGTEKER